MGVHKLYEFSATLPYSSKITDDGSYLVVQVYAPEGQEAEQKRRNALATAEHFERIAREIREAVRA